MSPESLNVEELLKTHATNITSLQTALGDDLKSYCDNIWLLRYILSHDADIKAATSAAKATIDWRTNNAELLQCAKEKKPHGEYFQHIQKYIKSNFHAKTTRTGAPFYLIRAGVSNPKACMDRVSHQEMLNYLLYHREQMYIQVDEKTRKTGQIVKVITINDFAHVSLFSGQEKRFMKALQECSKMAEDFFPQLMGRAVMINMPSFIYSVFALMKSLLSKKTVAKIAFCPGSTATGDITKCPFVKANFDIDAVPSFLGGTCKCKGGCMPGCSNEQSRAIDEEGEDGQIQKVVAARDKLVSVVEVEKDDVILWEIEVKDKGLEVNAILKVDGGNEINLLETRKIKAEKQQGSLTAPKAGVCVFTFDNSYSYVNSKSVKYRIERTSVSDLGVTNKTSDDIQDGLSKMQIS